MAVVRKRGDLLIEHRGQNRPVYDDIPNRRRVSTKATVQTFGALERSL
jgi:hypothetical protein